MSLFSVHPRKHTAYYDHLMPRAPGGDVGSGDTSGTSVKSQPADPTCVASDPASRRGRLTLRRRSRRTDGAEAMGDAQATPGEKRLTLQRRSKAPSADKRTHVHRGPPQSHKVLGEPNGRDPPLFRSLSLKETRRDSENKVRAFKTPTKTTPFERIAARRDVFEKMAMREGPRRDPRGHPAANPPVPAPRVCKAPPAVQKAPAHTSNQKGDVARTSAPTDGPAPTSGGETSFRPSEVLKKQDSFKMENSAVTVAVRVRPFNARFVMTSARPRTPASCLPVVKNRYSLFFFF